MTKLDAHPREQTTSRANASACRLRNLFSFSKLHPELLGKPKALPPISPARLAASRNEDDSGYTTAEGGEKTVLYLAYGSNLCYETFQGRRGIRPLAQLNVVVPDLRMTFDLAGIPYSEPCFANSGLRQSSHELKKSGKYGDGDYHKDRWHKGMVGVVYEVTVEDYRHIIATEGGGAAYKDILITCHELIAGEEEVPEYPVTEAFRVHTLFAPPVEPGAEGGAFRRPDPSYAQPSPRYLKLITDGADEHVLPKEYKEYLHSIRGYTAVTQGQQMGRFVFEMLWLPFMMLVLELDRKYQDDEGKAPKWVQTLMAMVLVNLWRSYDNFFKPIFGDGERSEERKERRRKDEEWGEKS